MTWVKFISWLLGLYAFYYVLNILWDVMRSKSPAAAGDAAELHFEEPVVPKQVAVEAETPTKQKTAVPVKGDPPASAMGGVNLKDLFNLAKAEVIVYNRAVSF